jgi:hypothetical protein
MLIEIELSKGLRLREDLLNFWIGECERIMYECSDVIRQSKDIEVFSLASQM